MMRHAFWSVVLCLPVAFAHVPQAVAEPMVVEVDQSTMLSISSVPGAVVIGNPTVADVTVQGSKLLIHGRSFGTTNVIALDQDGEQIVALEISVRHEPEPTLALFKGSTGGATSRFSYSCVPLCESELQVGDDVLFNATIAEQTKNKIKLATGQEDSKSEAPPAPQ